MPVEFSSGSSRSDSALRPGPDRVQPAEDAQKCPGIHQPELPGTRLCSSRYPQFRIGCRQRETTGVMAGRFGSFPVLQNVAGDQGAELPDIDVRLEVK